LWWISQITNHKSQIANHKSRITTHLSRCLDEPISRLSSPCLRVSALGFRFQSWQSWHFWHFWQLCSRSPDDPITRSPDGVSLPPAIQPVIPEFKRLTRFHPGVGRPTSRLCGPDCCPRGTAALGCGCLLFPICDHLCSSVAKKGSAFPIFSVPPCLRGRFSLSIMAILAFLAIVFSITRSPNLAAHPCPLPHSSHFIPR
jgi:hypothetical protein